MPALRESSSSGPGPGAASMPVMAFALHGSLVIGTDVGEWFSLGAGVELEALAAIGPASAAVCDATGALTVASWEPRLARLRGGVWSTIALAAPAVALAALRRGLVIADASGGISLLAGASHAPVQELAAGEPVLALARGGGAGPGDGDGIVALLAGGAIAVSGWPGQAAPAALAPVDASAIGRVHAVFPGIVDGTVLVAGARGLGLLDRGRLVAVAGDLGDRIAGAAVFGGRGRALVHTDAGDAWIVDGRLSRMARTAPGAIAGCSPGDDGTVLAWTTGGVLQAIGSDGAHRTLAADGVVLAAPEVGRIGAIAIHWATATGVRVTRGHTTWT